MLELFNGGLVTSRPAPLLVVGELQQCKNLVYEPASPSLRQALGWGVVSGAAGSPIDGLVHCAFDNGTSLLVVQAGDNYLSAPADVPAHFTSLVAQGRGSALERVHYNDKHFLFNGVGPNRVLLKDGTIRRHGMVATTQAPAGLVTPSDGAWPLIDDTLPTMYEYWHTEVYKSADEEIESTFTGTPTTINIPSATAYVTLYRPNIVNSSATHWRVYRSTPKKDFSAAIFPVGFLVADVPVATETFVDGLISTVAMTPASSAVSNAVVTALPHIPSSYHRRIAGVWTNPSNALATDGSFAVSPTLTLANAGFRITSDEAELVFDNFGFTNITSPVVKINVEVKGKKSSSGEALVYLSWDGGRSWTDGKSVGLTTSNAVYTIEGGTWGRIWAGGTDFVNGNFRVLLRAKAAKNFFGDTSTTGTVSIDSLKVSLNYGGTTGAQDVVFPSTDISVGGVTYKNGAYGEPPAASFGDIHEDSLVVNDPTNKGIIRYSIETLPDAFAPEYYLPLRTNEHDEVTAIKSLGSSLVVGLNTYVARIDYLPRAEDSEFSRGRCWDIVQGSYGIVGKKACVRFFLPGVGLFLAYVSRHGPMMTNGYQADTLTDDLNFASLVDITKLDQCEFINYPAKYKLVLHYTPPGEGHNTKALHFYYHPSHVKNGKLKVTGPMDVNCSGAAVAVLPSGDELFYTAFDQYLYREGFAAPTPYILETREIHPGGPGTGSEIQGVLLHQRGGGRVKVTPKVFDANTEPRVEKSAEVTAPSYGFAAVPFRAGCGGVAFTIEPIEAGDELNFLVIDATVFGKENYPK